MDTVQDNTKLTMPYKLFITYRAMTWFELAISFKLNYWVYFYMYILLGFVSIVFLLFYIFYHI